MVLTAKQRQIIELLSEGSTIKQVAELRGVTYSTISITLARAKARLGISSTIALVAYCIREGIIE